MYKPLWLALAGLLLAGCQQAPLSCQSASHSIAQVQGIGDESPLLGQTVTIQGLVLGVVYADGPLPGLMLQSLTPDQDPRTAEAIFIALPNATQYQSGQVLQVRGTVAEVEQLTSLINTEILETCGQRQAEPLAVSLPLPTAQSWEAYEGMWLRIEQPLVVIDSFNLGRYGELMLADQRLMMPTQIVVPGEAAQQMAADNARRSILLDDGSYRQNPDPLPYPDTSLSAYQTLRVGDQVLNVEGILHQDGRGYRLLPTARPAFVNSNPRPEAPAKTASNELRVASYNVLNFFTGHGQPEAFPTRRGARNPTELQRQQEKLVVALLALDADIIGLLELENNGYADGSASATLLAALNERSSEPYQQVIAPVTPGGDDIKVGIFYRPSRVSAEGQAATQTAAPFTRLHRPPLAQSFRHTASGELVTVTINHFKSKGSCPRRGSSDYLLQRDQGDGQACWNAARLEAAAAMHSWLATQPTGVNTDYQVIMGDFNAYRQEDPIRWFEQQGWQYLDDGKAESYSFVFRGQSGSLDHLLVSPALAEKRSAFQHWPINADEPVLLDYSTRFKPASQREQLFAPLPYRSSDHDPILATFRF